MDILFIQVGGTIDKDYPSGDDNHGYAFEIGEPAFRTILRRAGVTFKYGQHRLMQKDSLDMTDEDRRILTGEVYAGSEKRVVVTHGTDTIGKSAKAIALHANAGSKTVVLTGARLPAKFRDSDADFNLGLAAAAVQCMPPGIYIALHGKIILWNKFMG